MIPPLHRYANSEAGRLLRELRAVQPKKGKYARRAELLLKGEALDLLTTIGAPRNVAKLFDAALGDVRDRLNELHPTRPWVEAAAEYEVKHGKVTHSEIVDQVVMPARPHVSNRQGVLKEVRQVRKTDWYKMLVENARIVLIDGEN